MKLEKTASGSNKVTISKAEWLHIGKQAGWTKTAEPDGLTGGQTGVWQDQFSRLLQDLTSEHEQLRHLTNYEERFDRVKQMIALANKVLQSLEKHKQDIWKQIEPTWRPIPANIKLNNP